MRRSREVLSPGHLGPLFSHLLLLALFCLSFHVRQAWAQAVPVKSQRPAQPKKASKLTLQQQRGLRLLQAAEAESASLQPDMRTFVLMQVARGYAKTDSVKRDALLHQAFSASLSIEDIAPEEGTYRCPELEGCGIKTWLQREILTAISSPAEVERLLPSAHSQVRSQMTDSLIRQYIQGKNFAKAKELITWEDSEGHYPYDCAGEMIRALPRRSPERTAVFSQALDAYSRQGDSPYFSTEPNGMTGLVVQFAHEMPPEIVLEAVDKILRNAKEQGEDPHKNLHITFSGRGGTASLSSNYRYQLFELLPALRELDPPKAESLLREEAELQDLFKRFPNGAQSLQPEHKAKNGSQPANEEDAGFYATTVSMGDDRTGPVLMGMEAEQEFQRNENKIAAEALTDPKQAITDAMALPEIRQSMFFGEGTSPRARVLLAIAKKIGKKNPEATADALSRARKCLAQTSLEFQANILNDAAEKYLEIGDEDDADKTIREAVQVAEKTYAKDNDADDPNRVFKGTWPSTHQWRRCVELSARFSPNTAEAIIAGIKDPEVAAFEKVYFASALMGVPSSPMTVAQSTKSGTRFGTY